MAIESPASLRILLLEERQYMNQIEIVMCGGQRINYRDSKPKRSSFAKFVRQKPPPLRNFKFTRSTISSSL